MSNSAILKSSLVKKYWMAVTGLFLCLFLIGHLAGNLQFLGEVGEETSLKFDRYAHFMTTNPLVKVLSYLTYISILFHAIDGIMLTVQNRKARPQQYAYNNPQANTKWYSRYMALLGSTILLFIIIHMANFWGRMHFGDLPTYADPGDRSVELKPLYTLVLAFFNHPDYGAIAAILYAVAMVALGFHLAHGFQSAFQTLGVNHQKWTPIIQKAGMVFSIVVPLLFAIIPLYLAFNGEVSAEEAEFLMERLSK